MSEYNLCGVLLHARHEEMDVVRKQLEKQQGVEIHAVTDDGRLVITVEDESRKKVADRIMNFHRLDGVISASMIYQFSDDDNNELNESNPSEERMSA